MRTYYIEFERQGCMLAIVKAEAESFEEAKFKAFEALHANDDIGEISADQARDALESGEINCILDEDGFETEPEGEEDD